MTPTPEEWECIWTATPDAYLLLDPALNIVRVSNAYLSITHAPAQIVGLSYWMMVPHDPNDPYKGRERSEESFATVLRTRQPHVMGVVRNDVPTESGRTIIRYWMVTNTPVVCNGEVAYIIHRLDDITALMNISEKISIISESMVAGGEGLAALKYILPLPPSGTRQHPDFDTYKE